MTTLIEAFRQVPDGRKLRDSDVTTKKIGEWIHRRLFSTDPNSAELLRRRRMRRRVDLYKNRGMAHFEAMIRDVFVDPVVREDRLKMLRYSDFQNVTRRIVSELSTVYATETRRRVDSENESYQEFLSVTRFDQKMRRANAYANLLNDPLVFIRSAERGGEAVPIVEVIPPSAYAPIAHPLDPTHLVAVVIDSFPGGLRVRDEDPHYWVYDSEQIFALDRHGRYVEGSQRPNPAREIPAVLINRELPDNALLDEWSGEDIVQAHLAVALLNTLMMRGQKTGTKLPYLRGDATHLVRGQHFDSDKPTELPEDTELNTIDLSHDPESLIASARSTIAQTAANYGIPEDVFNQSLSASSGHERELKLVGLRQRRQDQILVFRDAERELAEKSARVLPRLGVNSRYLFDPTGWSAQFGEVTTPMSPGERITYRKESRRLATRSPLDDVMEDNPDIRDREQAAAQIQIHLKEFADFIEMSRSLNVHNGADAGDPGSSAQDNGAEGGRRGGLRAIAEEVLDAA